MFIFEVHKHKKMTNIKINFGNLCQLKENAISKKLQKGQCVIYFNNKWLPKLCKALFLPST